MTGLELRVEKGVLASQGSVRVAVLLFVLVEEIPSKVMHRLAREVINELYIPGK